MTRFADRAFLCTVLLCSSLYALGFYWWFVDGELFPVDEILTPPYISATPKGESISELRAGDIIYANWHFMKFRNCKSDFQRKLINTETTEIVRLEEHHGLATSSLGEKQYPSRMQLPARLEPGLWEYHLMGVFHCNPLRPQIVSYPPVPFRIVD